MTEDRKRRVLLKLSGEAFGGGQLGVKPDVVSAIAKEIAAAAPNVEIAIVVGGGNFFRGAELSQRGMDRGRADYMGMLGMMMNALALQDFLEQAAAEGLAGELEQDSTAGSGHGPSVLRWRRL